MQRPYYWQHDPETKFEMRLRRWREDLLQSAASRLKNAFLALKVRKVGRSVVKAIGNGLSAV